MRNKYATLWIWMCLCPLALDYKAPDADSGHAAQVLLVAPTLAAALALIFIAPRFRQASPLRRFVTLCLMLSVPGSLISQLVQGNDFGNYLRVVLPFLLFLLGYAMACHPWHENRIGQIEKALFWANLICLVFTFIFGIATGGGMGGIADVRFRIVSVTLLGLQGVLLHEFVLARRFSPFMLAVFLGTVLVELLSVTRSLLIGTMLLFLMAAWMSAPSLRYLLRSALRVFIVSVVLGAMAAAAIWSMPSVSEHWMQRFTVAENTQTGKDPTTITRLAEIKDQVDQVTSSAQSLLLGEGYGHYYRYSPQYLPDLAGTISEKDFYAIHEWAAGHNFWIYQLFAGGLLFGIGLPLAVLVTLWHCATAYRRWRGKNPGAPLLPVFGRAILLLAALPATSIGGNPLGPRFSGLVFGVALGLTVATYCRLHRQLDSKARSRVEPVAPQPATAAVARHGPAQPPAQPPRPAPFAAASARGTLQDASGSEPYDAGRTRDLRQRGMPASA
ncbi:O-antigen ligase family protein [Paraburkholderia azotifigens]|uniref:O-antigen ligase family protein n=1 Tax=Paraburkholderia azotifigens TaxID=2057004 RepID=A0A5C6VW50_9BURK|nr:O-antigen ligase family protein [Paraburkholderia azotifigens]TXC88734.1 O-antigen ligase family protein [Paraburkholderia azotifigens]